MNAYIEALQMTGFRYSIHSYVKNSLKREMDS